MFSVVHPFLTAAAKNVGFFRIPCMIQQKRREGDRMQERQTALQAALGAAIRR